MGLSERRRSSGVSVRQTLVMRITNELSHDLLCVYLILKFSIPSPVIFSGLLLPHKNHVCPFVLSPRDLTYYLFLIKISYTSQSGFRDLVTRRYEACWTFDYVSGKKDFLFVHFKLRGKKHLSASRAFQENISLVNDIYVWVCRI